METILKKRWLQLLLAVVLVVTMMPLAAYADPAETDNPQAAEEVVEPIANSEEPEVVVEEPATEPEEIVTFGGGISPMGLEPLAVMDGIDLSTSADELKYTLNDAMNGSQLLMVTAEFDSANSTTDRRIEISLAEGMAFSNVPGFKWENNTWVFDDSLMPADLRGIFNNANTKFLPSNKITFSNGVFQPAAGTFIYDAGTNNVGKAVLSLTVKLDNPYGVKNGDVDKTINNAVTVKTSQKLNGGAATEIEKQSLEKYTVSGISGFYAYLGKGDKRNTVVDSSSSGSLYYSLGSRFDWSGNKQAWGLYDEIGFTMVFPKGIQPAATDPITFRDASLYKGVDVVVTTSSDANNNYLHITFENLFIPNTVSQELTEFTVNFETDAGLVPGTVYPVSAKDYSIKPYGSTYSSSGADITRNFAPQEIVVASAGDTVSVIPASQGQAIHGGAAYVDPDKMDAGDMTWLGAFNLANETTSELNDQAIKYEFPNTVNVRAVRLPVGSNGKLPVLKAVTYEGKTIELTNYFSYAAGTTGNEYVVFTLNDYASSHGVSHSDGIEYIEFEVTNIPVGYGSSRGMYAASAVGTFFGTFKKGQTSAFDIKTNVVSGGMPTSWPATETTITMRVFENGTVAFSLPGLNTNNTYQAGQTYTIATNVSVEGSNIVSPHATYVKGYEIYLRETDSFVIDTNSLVITQYEGSASSIVTPSSIQLVSDSEGQPVYKVTVPDLKAGYRGVDGVSNYYFNIKYDAKVKASVASSTRNADELLYVRPIQYAGVVQPDGGTNTNSYYNSLNKFNVAGEGDLDKRYGTLDSRKNVTIYSATDFTVSTAARLEMGSYDSGWITYDDTNAVTKENTTLGANSNGTLSYKVTAVNNTDATDSQFAIHIPIPREGETFKGQPFGFSTAIKDKIQVNGAPVSITYSKSYEKYTNNATSFVSWDPADASEYKTIRIESAGATMPANSSYEFSFVLEIIKTTSEITSLAGESNIYSSLYTIESSQVKRYDSASEPVAMRLDTGTVIGMIYNDIDRNGSYNSGTDTPRGQVLVQAYESNGTTPIGDPVSTDASGMFSIPGLKVGENIVVKVVNPLASTDMLRFASDYTTAAVDFIKTAIAGTLTNADAYGLVIGLGAPYTISWDDNTTSPATFTPAYRYPGDNTTLVAPTASAVTGYDTVNWYSVKNAMSGGIVPGGYVTNTHKDITFYANRRPNPITVNYNLNNGGDPTTFNPVAANTNTTYGSTVTKPTDPTRGAFTFKGWFDTKAKADAWSSNTAFDFTVGLTENKTLYAAWESTAFHTVSYINGDTARGTMTPTTASESVANGGHPTSVPTITANTGYVFVGWEAKEGSTVTGFFVDEAQVKNYTVTKNVTFTAQYGEINKATVIFNYDGGRDSSGKSFSMVTGNTNDTLNAPTVIKAGHTFSAWDPSVAAKFGTAGSVTVYTATWTANPYTVTYDKGAHGTMSPDPKTETVSYNNSPTQMPTITVDSGYTFIGWRASGAGTKGVFTTTELGSYKVTADVTFTAQYAELANEVIVFDYAGGMVGGYTSGYASGKPGSTYAVPTPTKVGYTLSGWTPSTPSGTFTTAGAVTAYTATWAPVQKTVAFDKGAHGTMNPDPATATVNYGANVTSVPTITTDTGYIFIGWESDKTSGIYDDAAVLSYPITDDVTFTAQYVDDTKATVIFNFNGGVDASGKGYRVMEDFKDATYTLPVGDVDFTRQGHTFSGWNSVPNGIFGAAGSVVEYTAQWAPNPYNVSFLAGANGTMNPTTYSESVAHGFMVTNVPTINCNGNGYDFVGWCMNGGATVYCDADVLSMPITGHTEFVAQYQTSANSGNTGNSSVGTETSSGNGKNGGPGGKGAPRTGDVTEGIVGGLVLLAIAGVTVASVAVRKNRKQQDRR